MTANGPAFVVVGARNEGGGGVGGSGNGSDVTNCGGDDSWISQLVLSTLRAGLTLSCSLKPSAASYSSTKLLSARLYQVELPCVG